MIAKLKSILAIISGVALIAFLYRLFSEKPLKEDGAFPLADEKKAAEKEVAHVKEELKELDNVEYSNEEIEEKFNGKS